MKLNTDLFTCGAIATIRLLAVIGAYISLRKIHQQEYNIN